MRKWLIVAMAAALTLGGVSVRAGLVGASSPPDVTCTDMPFSGTAHNLTVPAGMWCDVNAATIVGNLTANGSSGLGVWDGTTIGGNLQASNITGAADPIGSGINFLCNTVVHGDVQIHNSTAAAPWNIGGTNPAFMNSRCGLGSFIGGNLQFNNNLGTPNNIANNDIENNFQCQNNAAPVTGGPNGADGNSEGQCASPIGGKGDAGGEPQMGADGDGAE